MIEITPIFEIYIYVPDINTDYRQRKQGETKGTHNWRDIFEAVEGIVNGSFLE